MPINQGPGGQQQPFYTPDGFRDQVHDLKRDLGKEGITWDVLLLAAAENPNTAALLRAEGINTKALAIDVEFKILYGKQDKIVDLYKEAVDEILEDLEKFDGHNQASEQSPEYREALGDVKGFLEYWVRSNCSNEQDTSRQGVKAALLSDAVGGFIQQTTAQGQQQTLDTEDGEGNLDDPTGLVAASNAFISAHETLQNFQSYVYEKNKARFSEDKEYDATSYLDGFHDEKVEQTGGRAGLEPRDVISTLKINATKFIEYALYHNGLQAPQGYTSEIEMSNPTVEEHAIKAYHGVWNNREEEVTPEDMLPSLLQDKVVLMALKKLGVENYIEFANTVRDELITAAEDEVGERFNIIPKVGDDIKEFIAEVDEVVSEVPEGLASARIFGELIKRDVVQGILEISGLDTNNLDQWDDVISELEAKGRYPKDVNLDFEGISSSEEFADAMEQFTTDMVQEARDGKYDPVIGRDDIISKVERAYTRRKKGNPVVIADEGTGKTAIFEGLAIKIANDDVQADLIGAKLILLDMAAMRAGATYQGQFEDRLKLVLNGIIELNQNGENILLVNDEIHTLENTNAGQGAPGAGNMLKPALASGDLRLGGATTYAEYVEHIEPSGAWNRRFTKIMMDEPNHEQTVAIIEKLQVKYAEYHSVEELTDEQVETVVSYAEQYLWEAHNPDRAIDLMDDAFALAKQRELDTVNIDIIAEVTADRCNLAIDFIKSTMSERIDKLEEALKNGPEAVLDQPEAVDAMIKALRRADFGVNDPNKPLMTALLLGPTGTGKTYIAKMIAKYLFGDEEAMTRIDGAEYGGEYDAPGLIGTKPGYVGYGEEGALTGSVRRRPFQVLLLDEMDKMHKNSRAVVMKILDEAELKDGKGRKANYRNTFVIGTGNTGQAEAREAMTRRPISFNAEEQMAAKQAEGGRAEYEAATKQEYRPEVLNRWGHVIIFNGLEVETAQVLTKREVNKISDRMKAGNHKLSITVSDAVIEAVAKIGFDPINNAREIDRAVIKELTDKIIDWAMENRGLLPKQGGNIHIESLDFDEVAPKIKANRAPKKGSGGHRRAKKDDSKKAKRFDGSFGDMIMDQRSANQNDLPDSIVRKI